MDKKKQESQQEQYLSCEHRSVFLLLMMTSGMMGAYTFIVRGGVFCNAQTANVVMMSIALGQGRWKDGIYFLIPITAYLSGAFISEILPSPVKRHGIFRWDTILIAIEMVILFLVGWIPLTVTNKIVQIIINFLASMQYNTFRQAEGIPMATTFCTNHVRQIGIAIAKILRKHDQTAKTRLLVHFYMLLGFLGGGILLSALCNILQEKAIWLSLIPLGIIFIDLMHADIKSERGELDRKPHGH